MSKLKKNPLPFKSRVKKWFKVLLFSGIALITFGALLLAEENWRTEKAWKNMQQEIADRGEPLSWEDLVSSDIPDDENFAMTPLFRPMTEYTIDWSGNTKQVTWNDPEALERAKARLPTQQFMKETRDGRTDLKGWRQAFDEDDGFKLPEIPGTAAEDVLFALQKYDEIIIEIIEASQRPQLRYIKDEESIYAGVILNPLSVIKSWARVLSLKSSAQLATGNAEGALENIQTLFRLAELLEQQPLLIVQLFEIAINSISIRAFWQGWADHRWSGEQLIWFQNYFSARDIRQIVPGMCMGERSLSNVLSGLFIQGKSGSENNRSSNVMERVILLQNQIASFRLFNVIIDSTRKSLKAGTPLFKADENFADSAGIPEVSKFEKSATGLLSVAGNAYKAIAIKLVPAVTLALAKFDRAQVTIELAATVCALERYWLENDRYPENLTSLVPNYLPEVPLDLMNGEPFHYQRREEGWFNLYSVGQNKTDNDGNYIDEQGKAGNADYPWPLPVLRVGQRFF